MEIQSYFNTLNHINKIIYTNKHKTMQITSLLSCFYFGMYELEAVSQKSKWCDMWYSKCNFKITFFFYFYMHLHVYLCTTYMHVVPLEARRSYWISYDWSYRWLCTVVWVLRIEPRSSGSIFSHWTISPEPHTHQLYDASR